MMVNLGVLLVLLSTTTSAFVPSVNNKVSFQTTKASSINLFPLPKNSNSNPIDKGFNLLEIASQIIPQGAIVATAKESWRLLWQRFMVELAPQDKTGSYQRPSYPFQTTTIGSLKYPANRFEADRYHVYVGNPCPWCHRVRLVTNILGLEQQQQQQQQPQQPVSVSAKFICV